MTSPSPQPQADPLLGRDVGGYVVETPLGEGGMGLVYRARHPILNRHFAVKVLRPEVAADATLSTSFIREAQTLSSLKHPNIIDIVGFGQLDAQQQYMVMEFLEGHTLEAELLRHGRLTPERALALADQVLDGLVAAHSVEVVHRDLKPSNVFLARVSGGAELVKLLDFGLARQQPEQLMSDDARPALASVAAGTPEYVAPEQASGLAANKHSDLYSFGVMLFEMLTGARPFQPSEGEQDPVRALIQMHARTPAPNLSSVVQHTFPEELETLVADLLAKDPKDRPSSAQTVRSRLQQVQRSLAQQLTQQRRNPLLDVSEAPSPKEPEPETLAVQRRSLATWLVVPVVAFLALVGWWLFGLKEDAPPPAPAVAVAPPPVPVPLPAPAVKEAPLEELTPLPPAPKPEKPAPALVVPSPKRVSTKVEVTRASCEPTERWKQIARTHLQELQEAAAGSTDPKAWPRFERAEPALSTAITNASTGADCESVDRWIQDLARSFSH